MGRTLATILTYVPGQLQSLSESGGIGHRRMIPLGHVRGAVCQDYHNLLVADTFSFVTDGAEGTELLVRGALGIISL